MTCLLTIIILLKSKNLSTKELVGSYSNILLILLVYTAIFSNILDYKVTFSITVNPYNNIFSYC